MICDAKIVERWSIIDRELPENLDDIEEINHIIEQYVPTLKSFLIGNREFPFVKSEKRNPIDSDTVQKKDVGASLDILLSAERVAFVKEKEKELERIHDKLTGSMDLPAPLAPETSTRHPFSKQHFTSTSLGSLKARMWMVALAP